MSESGEEGKKKVGRPPKYAPGKRPIVTFRVSEELYERFRKQAEASGRSLSEEVERRVQRSFEWDDAFGTPQSWLAEQKDKINNMTEETAEVFLRRAGWPKINGGPRGTTLSKPGSIAFFPDGRMGRVKRMPFPPGGFEIEPDEALGVMEPAVAPAGLDNLVERAVERGVEKALQRAGVVPAGDVEPSA